MCIRDSSLPPSPFLPARVVQRFVEPHATVHTGLHQTLEVLDRFRRVYQQSESGGIGCYYQIVLQPAFEAEGRNAKSPVLIDLVRIESAVCRFGDSPRHTAILCVLNLALYRRGAGVLQQGVAETAHEQDR